MSIWNLFTLLSGLALFIYGITLMNKSLTSIAGNKMKTIMLTLTKNRPRGYLTGLGITIVNQSSSATTVLEAALVGAGLMTFHQSVAVTLGAELGSTFLPHIIAFPAISKFAPLMIGASVLAYIRLKKERSINISFVILGFGFLLLGMDMMSDSVRPLREFQPFINLMTKAEIPILGILIGILFTMIIQSAGATTGLAIAMARADIMTLEQAIPITLGAAIGTCTTAILGSLALNWDAKRSAYIHVLFQVIGVIFSYILLEIPLGSGGERVYVWLTKWITATVFRTDDLERQIAVGFSLMPIINHIFLFGIPKFLNATVALFEKMFPPREREKPFSVKYLQEQLVDGSIDIALEMAKKEILIGADLVKSMFGKVDPAFKSKDMKIINEISETDIKVDLLYKAIILFLARISRKELGQEETKRSMNYLYIENDLESIGDIIDKNLMSLAKRMIDFDLNFSEQGSKELSELHGKILDNMNRMVIALTEENFELAKEITNVYSDINETYYQRSHIERLHKGLKVSIDTSSIHLDVVNYYSRINEHVVYISERIIWLTKKHV